MTVGISKEGPVPGCQSGKENRGEAPKKTQGELRPLWSLAGLCSRGSTWKETGGEGIRRWMGGLGGAHLWMGGDLGAAHPLPRLGEK